MLQSSASAASMIVLESRQSHDPEIMANEGRVEGYAGKEGADIGTPKPVTMWTSW